VQVVLDTSVLVSAIRSDAGAAAEIVRLVVLGRVSILMDFKLACEYSEVALRTDHIAASDRTLKDVQGLIRVLEDISMPVLVVTKHRPLSPDADDDMVLDVAINGFADAIVTINVRDFALAAQRFAIPVLTPRDFLLAFRKGEFSDAD
jgi:putative PIN family toxin of toxin-antitoxin system